MAAPESDWLDALRSLMPDASDADPETTAAEQESTDSQEQKQNGRVDIMLDKKGRHGKLATIIAGFDVDDNHLASIASKIKSRLGCGGSARGGEILIQGDRRKDVAALLSSMNIKNKII